MDMTNLASTLYGSAQHNLVLCVWGRHVLLQVTVQKLCNDCWSYQEPMYSVNKGTWNSNNQRRDSSCHLEAGMTKQQQLYKHYWEMLKCTSDHEQVTADEYEQNFLTFVHLYIRNKIKCSNNLQLHSLHGCVSELWRCTYVVMKRSQEQEDVPQELCWQDDSCARPCWRTSNHKYSMVLRCLEKRLIHILALLNPRASVPIYSAAIEGAGGWDGEMMTAQLSCRWPTPNTVPLNFIGKEEGGVIGPDWTMSPCIQCQNVHISKTKALGTHLKTTNTKYLGNHFQM